MIKMTIDQKLLLKIEKILKEKDNKIKSAWRAGYNNVNWKQTKEMIKL